VQQRRLIVAIDGPAGAGKSTVARNMADALGYVLVDTGALYRAVALAAIRARQPLDDGESLGALARGLVERVAVQLARGPTGETVVRLDGEDVSALIRTPDVSQGASRVSVHPEVRDALLDLQRALGRGGGVVLEGRDIGTVVFPDADLKFFLTARDEVRAQRRMDELHGRGERPSFDETLAEVRLRDARDSTRDTAPLRQADDAILVDTSDMTLDAVVASMVARARSAAAAPHGESR
jgi:cytidylate kinase